MRQRSLRVASVCGWGIALLLAGASRAAEDTFTLGGLGYKADVEIKGISGSGKLVAAIAGGADKGYDLSQVTTITLAASGKFNEAEALRESNPKASAAAYKKAIAEINNAQLKLLAQLRAVGPTEADGKYSEALGYFLEVYGTLPTEAIWGFRPTKLPSAGSTMLKEASDRLAGAIRGAKTEDARKNLKTLQLDLLTRAGDVEGAQRLAKEIATGVAEPDKNAETTPPAAGSPVLADVENALRAKDFEGALKKADAVLLVATGDTAVQAFLLKARAFEEMNKPELAVGTLLRIPAHFPGYERNAAVVWQAAELQKRAGHAEEAKALLQEIRERYPESPEAVRVGGAP